MRRLLLYLTAVFVCATLQSCSDTKTSPMTKKKTGVWRTDGKAPVKPELDKLR